MPFSILLNVISFIDGAITSATFPGQSQPEDNDHEGSSLHSQEFKNSSHISRRGLVGWLVGFCGISTFVGYFMPNPFLYK